MLQQGRGIKIILQLWIITRMSAVMKKTSQIICNNFHSLDCLRLNTFSNLLKIIINNN